MRDSITLLTTLGGIPLAKTWLADGTIRGYGRLQDAGTTIGAKNYTMEQVEVSGIADIFTTINQIRGYRDCCAIRGTYNGHPLEKGRVLRRKTHFSDRPHNWVMFDVDGFMPIFADPEDPHQMFEEWTYHALPAAFRNAAFVWQLSGSHGHPKKPGLHGHIWFWLERAYDSDTLAAWVTSQGLQDKIDRSVLDSVQVHYTADPIFEDGVDDPCPHRLGMRDGAEAVDLQIDLEAIAENILARPVGTEGEHVYGPDPRDKKGPIGAFCRRYSIADVLTADWFEAAGEFEQVTDARWTWLGGHGAAEGVRIDATGLVNTHNTAPWDTFKRRLNAFDVLRVYQFGHLDEGIDSWTIEAEPWTALSYKAAMALIKTLPEVQAELEAEREKLREQNRVIGEGCEFSEQIDVLNKEQMLERFVSLSEGSRVFDILFPKHVLPLNDFNNAYAASKTTVIIPSAGNGRQKEKTFQTSKLWLEDMQRKSAYGLTFKAGAGLYVNDPKGRHCVNLWGGFERIDSVAPVGVDLFVHHVEWLFGDRAEHFLDWLAHIRQSPGVLPHTSWLHIADYPGTGRNWLSSILARVFAGYAAPSLDLIATLESGFNDRLSGKVLAIIDEIREGGAQRWSHSEALKQLITAEVRTINHKYGRISEEWNACRFLIFSNFRQAIPVGDDDRRIEVGICAERPQDEAYYALLYSMLNDQSFIGAVGQFLDSRDISSYNPGAHALKTGAKQQVVLASQTDEVSDLMEFSFSYPFELATATRLMVAAGLTDNFGKGAARFTHVAEDAGWVKIGRFRYGMGSRDRIYARREFSAKWIGVTRGFEKQIPKQDGGEMDWMNS